MIKKYFYAGGFCFVITLCLCLAMGLTGCNPRVTETVYYATPGNPQQWATSGNAWATSGNATDGNAINGNIDRGEPVFDSPSIVVSAATAASSATASTAAASSVAAASASCANALTVPSEKRATVRIRKSFFITV